MSWVSGTSVSMRQQQMQQHVSCHCPHGVCFVGGANAACQRGTLLGCFECSCCEVPRHPESPVASGASKSVASCVMQHMCCYQHVILLMCRRASWALASLDMSFSAWLVPHPLYNSRHKTMPLVAERTGQGGPDNTSQLFCLCSLCSVDSVTAVGRFSGAAPNAFCVQQSARCVICSALCMGVTWCSWVVSACYVVQTTV